MRKQIFLFLILLVFPAMATAQGIPIPWAPTPPGLLEAFLSKTQNATVTRKAVGELVGPSRKATFTAIVAKDPSNPGIRMKGIEIEMVDADRKLKIYLDDDRSADGHAESLRQFVFGLKELATKVANTHFAEITTEPEARRTSVMAGAYNRAAGNPEYCCPRYTALDAGWYRQGEELGVRIDEAGKTRYGFTLYFPNAKLSQVADFLESGKDWLDSN
jgi:hypothetical protein